MARDPVGKDASRQKHDDAVDGSRDRHLRVLQDVKCNEDRERAVMNADLHGDGDGLTALQFQQSRQSVTHPDAKKIECKAGATNRSNETR